MGDNIFLSFAYIPILLLKRLIYYLPYKFLLLSVTQTQRFFKKIGIHFLLFKYIIFGVWLRDWKPTSLELRVPFRSSNIFFILMLGFLSPHHETICQVMV